MPIDDMDFLDQADPKKFVALICEVIVQEYSEYLLPHQEVLTITMSSSLKCPLQSFIKQQHPKHRVQSHRPMIHSTCYLSEHFAAYNLFWMRDDEILISQKHHD